MLKQYSKQFTQLRKKWWWFDYAVVAGVLALVIVIALVVKSSFKPKKKIYTVTVYGQSLSVGSKSVPPLTTDAIYPDSVFTFKDGPQAIGDELGPLMENGKYKQAIVETPTSAVTNQLFKYYGEDENTKFFSVTAGLGGRTIAALKDGLWKQRLLPRMRTGVSLMKSKFPEHETESLGMCWIQGEADRGSTIGKYKAEFEDMKAKWDALVASTHDSKAPSTIFTYQTAHVTGINAHSKTLGVASQAQLELHKEGLSKMVTPIYFMKHADDNTHLSAEASRLLGLYFARAVKQGRSYQIVEPISVKRRAEDEVVVTFHVPQKPLVFDKWHDILNNGFGVSDAVVTSTTIEGGDKVVIKTEAPIAPGSKVTYALAPEHIVMGTVAGGTLRDSSRETVMHGETLHRWCPHFEMALQD